MVGENLFEEFLKKKTEIEIRVENLYKIYEMNSTMYPGYEDFMLKCSSIYNNQSTSEKADLWNKYWQKNCDDLKRLELQERVQSLKENFKVTAELRDCKDPVFKALSLLESIMEEIGIFKPVLESLISECYRKGPKSRESIEIIKQHKDLFKVLKQKMLDKDPDDPKKILFNQIVKSLDFLIMGIHYEILTGSPYEEYYNSINVISLAKATLGKNTEEILDFIEVVFLCEGVLSTKDLKNKVYEKVCLLHFEMVQ